MLLCINRLYFNKDEFLANLTTIHINKVVMKTYSHRIIIINFINIKFKYITLSFMIVRHTKFAPDAGFGLINQKYKTNKC